MGLFDFVKDAGAKLFGGEEEKIQPKARAEGANVEELRNKHRQAVLKKKIEEAGLEITDLAVTVRGELAVIEGKVASQEAREKAVLVVGNVDGVARVDDRLEVDEPEQAEANFYTVQKGDTLSGIAKAQYGKASKYMVIFEANKPMLSDPDKIYPGQVLRIPALED